METLSVIGLGYVGLVTAVSFAIKGHKVVASDTDEIKVKSINKGIPLFFEPKLDKMLNEAIRRGNLKAVNQREEAILNSDIAFLTVGTPSLANGNIDLEYIQVSTEEIGNAIRKKEGSLLVVVKSTVIPGTTQNVIKPLLEKHSGKKAGKDFGLVVNPEFLREGSAIHDVFHPDRIIIGEFEEKWGNFSEEFYKNFYGDKIPIIKMSTTSAEMVKYACNAFLATKISFINEIANICEKVDGLDVIDVAQGIGLDSRISPKFLNAGAGWGGSCLPKDVKALVAFSRKQGYYPQILERVVSVNLKQAEHIVELAKRELGSLKGKKIAVLGLSFKPNTDDVREATSIRIIYHLLEEEAEVFVFDPIAINNARNVLGDRVNYSRTVDQCLKDADCCILVTEWDEFRKISPEDFIQLMRQPFLIDGRRIFNSKEFSSKLTYRAVGLGDFSIKMSRKAT